MKYYVIGNSFVTILAGLHAMMPSTVEATLVQGASFVFTCKGKEVLLEHYDASSGAHVSVDELLEIALLK